MKLSPSPSIFSASDAESVVGAAVDDSSPSEENYSATVSNGTTTDWSSSFIASLRSRSAIVASFSPILLQIPVMMFVSLAVSDSISFILFSRSSMVF